MAKVFGLATVGRRKLLKREIYFPIRSVLFPRSTKSCSTCSRRRRENLPNNLEISPPLSVTLFKLKVRKMKTSLTENKGNRSGSTIVTKFVVIYFAPGDEIKVEIVIGQRERGTGAAAPGIGNKRITLLFPRRV